MNLAERFARIEALEAVLPRKAAPIMGSRNPMTRFIRPIAFAVVIMPKLVLAQDMLPLEDLMDDASSVYTPTRCAALYQAILELTEAQQVDEEIWQDLSEDQEQMAYVAAYILNHDLAGSMDEAIMVVARDIQNITNIYLQRMEMNYSLSEQAFESDPIIRSDIAVCNLFTSMLREDQ